MSLHTLTRATLKHGTHYTGASLAPRLSRCLSSVPISVPITEEERTARRLGWRHLELATRALHRDGVVVLQNVIDHAKLDKLNKTMVEDAYKLQAQGDAGPFNYNKGNVQQDPPLTKEHFDSSIFLNAFATQVTTSVLGPKPRLSFISGNTALPPTPGTEPQSQPVHSDADFEHPESPFALVVNVPLIDMRLENGSTEVWLGTHTTTNLESQEGKHGDRASGRIRLDLLEERRQQRPPSQPFVPKGSLVIRDLRLWHAGKPNLSADPRIMLAMIHFAPWYRNTMTVEFAEELAPALNRDGGDLQIQKTLVKKQDVLEKYLHRGFGNSYDFDQIEPLSDLFPRS